MKNFKVLILVCVLLTQPLLASENSGVFTVDMAKLLRFSEYGKSIIAANNIARQNLQNENDNLEEKLLVEEKELSKLRETLSTDEFRPKALDFDKRVTIIREEQGKKEENLIKKNRNQEAEFFKKVYPLLYELLLKRGGSVLFDQRNIILWNNSVDITDEAIKLINQVFGNGEQTN